MISELLNKNTNHPNIVPFDNNKSGHSTMIASTVSYNGRNYRITDYVVDVKSPDDVKDLGAVYSINGIKDSEAIAVKKEFGSEKGVFTNYLVYLVEQL